MIIGIVLIVLSLCVAAHTLFVALWLAATKNLSFWQSVLVVNLMCFGVLVVGIGGQMLGVSFIIGDLP